MAVRCIGLNCNYCAYLATGKSQQIYVSSNDAHNIKKLPVANENVNGVVFSSSKISGSLGDSTCGPQGSGAVCYGDSEGLGTFARYNTITGLALQVTNDARSVDVALYIRDAVNNKIRRLELTSGQYRMATFDSDVDLLFSSVYGAAGLTSGGIALNSATNTLYVGVVGGIYKYDIAVGASSKTLLAGHQDSPSNPFAS